MQNQDGTVIFLDAGDTLIFARRTMHEAIVEVCRDTGATIEERFVRETAIAIKPTLGPVTTLDRDAFRGWWMRMYDELLRRCGYTGSIDAAREKLWDVWRSGRALRLFPDTLDALRGLRASEYRLAVVSNWDDTLDNALRRLDIRQYFEEVFASYLLGVEKPDPEIFHHALRVMNANPESVWHAGDSLESDVDGARNAGIRPIL
ncbi:MAG: HAD-IA family hydrolase, partial [bacterium]